MILLLILAYVILSVIEIWIRNGMMPEQLGYIENDFQISQIKEHCLSTLAVSKKERIDALPFVVDEEKSKALVLSSFKAIGKTQILKEEEHYIHLLFTSRTFKLHTDIELYFDVVLNRIHMNFATRSLKNTIAFNKRYYQLIKRIYMKYFTVPSDVHQNTWNDVPGKKEE